MDPRPRASWFLTQQLYTWSEHRFTKARFNLVRQRDPEVFAPHSHFVLKMHAKWDKVRRKYMRAFAPDQGGQLPVNGGQQAVLDVPTQSAKVAASSPTKRPPGSTIDEKGSPVESQRRLLEPSVDGEKDSAEGGDQNDESTAEKQAQDTVVEDMLDSSDARADVVEALGGEDLVGDDANPSGGDTSGNNSDTDGPSGNMSTTTQSNNPSSAPSAATSTAGDDDTIEILTETGSATGASTASKVAGSPVQRTAKSPIQNSSQPSQGSTLAVPSASVVSASGDPTNTTPSTLGSVGSQIAKQEATTIAHAEQERAARKEAGEPAPADDDICAPARDKGDTSMEYQLIKSLVDRVTRLEAQARQMLIDSMDKDLARTLLLADRNLQVRDAFRLYDQGIDVEKTYREEAEKARKEAAEAKREGGEENDQDDMLSRVRRYRSTFAEILVISSTLLRLEGDDLKQFERWHVGDLHHQKREGNLLTHGLDSPKGIRGAQQRAYSWAKDKKEHTVRVRDILLGSVKRKPKPSGSGSATPHRPSSRASSHRRRQGGQRRRSTVGRLVTDSEAEDDDVVEHPDPYDVPAPAPGAAEPSPPLPGGPSKLPIRAAVHPSLNLHIPARSETLTSPTTASADTPTDYNEYNRGMGHALAKDHRKAHMLKIFDHHAQGVLDDAQKESKAISSTLTQPTKNMVAKDAAVVYHAAEHVFKEVFMPQAAKREDEASIGRADDEREAEMKRDDALSQQREEKELEEEEEEDHGGSPAKAPPRASSSKAGGSGSKHKTNTKTDPGSSRG